jgi:glycosyltransferase involved in cell wall biosynthesis
MGGQKCIASFYQYLAEQLPVTVISTNDNEDPPPGKISLEKVLGTTFLRYLNPFLFFKTRKIIAGGNFTHLVVEHPYLGWLGLLHKKFSKVSLIAHSHNIEAMRFKSTGRWWWRILWQYEGMVHRAADRSFFITDEDRRWAEKHYQLEPSKCFTVTYGTELQNAPIASDQLFARHYLQSKHHISPSETILFFNGTLNYKPNLDALMILLNEINPILQSRPSFQYKLIICGKNLPDTLNELRDYRDKNIIYAGFVDDIKPYFEGSNIFLNPVIEGGGIKTKLVEALAFNLNCISTVSGATGIPTETTGQKLTVIPDGDWATFIESIFVTDINAVIPTRFFEQFYWGNIAARAIAILKNQP